MTKKPKRITRTLRTKRTCPEPGCTFWCYLKDKYDEHKEAHRAQARKLERSQEIQNRDASAPPPVPIPQLLEEIGVDNLSWQLLSQCLAGGSEVKRGGTKLGFYTPEALGAVALHRTRDALIVWVDSARIRPAYEACVEKNKNASLGGPANSTETSNSASTPSTGPTSPTEPPVVVVGADRPVEENKEDTPTSAPEVFCTSFCNKGHRMKDGMPVDHECYVLPPRALQLEREGKLTEAQNLLQETPQEERRISRGVSLDVDEVPPPAYYQGYLAAQRGEPRSALPETDELWLAGYDKYHQLQGRPRIPFAPQRIEQGQSWSDLDLTQLSAVGLVRGLLTTRIATPGQTMDQAMARADAFLDRLREEILAGVPKQRDPREYFEKYLEMGHVPTEPPILRKAMREGFDLVVRTLDGSSGNDGPDVPDGPVEEGFAPGFEERCGVPEGSSAKQDD